MIINTSKKSLCVMYLLLIAILTVFLNCKDSNPVNLHIPVENIILSDTQISLEVGEIKILTATIYPENATNQQIVWSSNDDDVAIISQDGVVEAISDGTATITATTIDGNVTSECSVYINSSDVFYVLNTIQWESAIDIISQGSDITNYTLMIINDFEVSGTRVNTFGDRNDIYVTIAGDQTISLSSDSTGHLLMIGDDTHITIVLNDIGLRGHYENYASLVHTGKNSTFIMQGSSSISDNRSGEFGGGGVYNEGVFTMKDNSSIFGNISGLPYSSSVSTSDGIINSETGVYKMSDNSTISGNITKLSGGGVVNSGFFSMSDNSSIQKNKAKYSGGVINLNIFSMSDYASIFENNAEYSGGAGNGGIFNMSGNSTVSKNTAWYIGGVGTDGTFFMSDYASISENTGYDSTGGVSNVGLRATGLFTMTDNTSIKNNFTHGIGGGAINDIHGVFTMLGNSTISGNRADDYMWPRNPYGGGVVNLASFFMKENASIEGNWGEMYGGGVFNSGYIFSMEDNASIYNNGSEIGGGIYTEYGMVKMSGNSVIYRNGTTAVFFIHGSFKMYGGIIYGNQASGEHEDFANYGSALFVGERTIAIYGDGTSILPHLDGFIHRTIHTIYGRE
ncbi:MAG: Ig-like domain-containing protein [Candidatus Cloacimonetes bacterium]|nr:Ig-like domain-containing protein [Candidatus Cloacimonadota bacterium]